MRTAKLANSKKVGIKILQVFPGYHKSDFQNILGGLVFITQRETYFFHRLQTVILI